MNPNEQHLVSQLERLGALVNGHFVYTTGLYGPQYIDKTVIYAHPPTTALFSSALAERFRGVEIDTVIAPATMGVVIVGAFCNRGNSTAATLDIPRLECLLHYELEAHSADNCPLCRAGVPVNSDLGHG